LADALAQIRLAFVQVKACGNRPPIRHHHLPETTEDEGND
jgi:hypothetical protein